MIVDNYKFEGRDFEVHLDQGTFWCKVDGERLHHKTQDGLVKQIRSAVREGASLKIEVAFIETDNDDLRKPIDYTPVTIIGTHAGSGNMIIEYEGGRRDQVRRYSNNFYRRLTTTEVSKLSEMVKMRIRLEREITAFKEARSVNGQELVETERKLQAAAHSNIEGEA